MIATPTTSDLPTDLQTVDEFEQWEKQYPHEGSYEFVRGRIISKPAMKQDKFYIADFLVRQFIRTEVFQVGHTLMPEGDSYVDDARKRVPDLIYVTVEQHQAIRRGERIKTLFAIELLSESESYDPERRPDVLDKLQDYFDAGAQLVCYIAPKHQKIFAYTSPDDSKTYKGQDVISAAPVVPELQFVVAEMFA